MIVSQKYHFLKEIYLAAYNRPPKGVAKHLAGLKAVRDYYTNEEGWNTGVEASAQLAYRLPVFKMCAADIATNIRTLLRSGDNESTK